MIYMKMSYYRIKCNQTIESKCHIIQIFYWKVNRKRKQSPSCIIKMNFQTSPESWPKRVRLQTGAYGVGTKAFALLHVGGVGTESTKRKEISVCNWLGFTFVSTNTFYILSFAKCLLHIFSNHSVKQVKQILFLLCQWGNWRWDLHVQVLMTSE